MDIFSGNLSWVRRTEAAGNVSDALLDAIKRGVTIKVMSRVDIASLKNVELVNSINRQAGFDAIELRHLYQPVRAFIVDDTLLRIKEEKTVKRYEKGELKDDLVIFYTITDANWVSWMKKVFWNLFNQALPVNERIKQLEEIENKMVSI